MADWYREAAKERQRDHGGTAPGRPKETLVEKVPPVMNCKKARDQAGVDFGPIGFEIQVRRSARRPARQSGDSGRYRCGRRHGLTPGNPVISRHAGRLIEGLEERPAESAGPVAEVPRLLPAYWPRAGARSGRDYAARRGPALRLSVGGKYWPLIALVSSVDGIHPAAWVDNRCGPSPSSANSRKAPTRVWSSFCTC